MPINPAKRRAKKESAKRESSKQESAKKRRQAGSLKKQGKLNKKSDYQQHIREKKMAEGARAKDGDLGAHHGRGRTSRATISAWPDHVGRAVQ